MLTAPAFSSEMMSNKLDCSPSCTLKRLDAEGGSCANTLSVWIADGGGGSDCLPRSARRNDANHRNGSCSDSSGAAPEGSDAREPAGSAGCRLIGAEYVNTSTY